MLFLPLPPLLFTAIPVDEMIDRRIKACMATRRRTGGEVGTDS